MISRDWDLLTFDCYGTLIDWEDGIGRALEAMLAQHGVSASRDELLQRFGKKWGLRHAMRLEQMVQRDYGITLREMESQMALELLSSSVGIFGLGKFEADLEYRDSGLIVIRHEDIAFEPLAAYNGLYNDLGLDFSNEVQQAIQSSSSRPSS